MKRALLILLVACGGSAPKPQPQPQPKPPVTAPKGDDSKELTGNVTKIRVEGASGSQGTVEAVVAAAKNKPINSDEVRRAARAAMLVAGVADVDIKGVQLADGVELVIDVTMEPTLKKLTAIEAGGKPISLGIGAVATGAPLEPPKIQALVDSLRERYLSAGNFDAEVSWKRVAMPGGVEVVIEVKPGEPSTLAAVTFKGNKVAAATLSAAVAKQLVVGQPVLEDKIDLAALELSKLYWDKGYANVRVKSPKPVPGKATLVFEIEEGPVFKIGKVEITGVPDADAQKLLKLFAVKKGDTFSRTAIANGRDKVAEAVIAGGRKDAVVLPLTKVDMSNKWIDLTLEVSSGNQ